MATLTAARLMGAWSLGSRASSHRRLAALLAATEGRVCRDDTLGERNRRLLRLHRATCRAPLEACVKCASCGVENELAVPVDAILESGGPAADARVRFKYCGRVRSFRLPRMSDLDAAACGAGDIRATVLDRCRVAGEPGAMHDAAAERLGRRFEAMDPAANIVVKIVCCGCGSPLAASVDVAALVAVEIDRLVECLYRDIDRIASAYGWDEAAILELPPERRRRYVEMIASRPGARLPARGAR